MNIVKMWDICVSHMLFDVGNYNEFLQKESIGSLLREPNSYSKYDSSFLNYFLKKEYKNSDDLYKAVYREVALLLAQCDINENGINMDTILNYIVPELKSQIVFGYPNTVQERMLKARCKGCSKIITVQINSPKTTYVGCLDKKIRKSDDSPYKYTYFRNMKWEKVYHIDLIRFLSELIVISECYRYYENILKDMAINERVDNAVFYKSCQYDRIFENGAAVAKSDEHYDKISELMSLLGENCIPGQNASQDYAVFAYLNGTRYHTVAHHNNLRKALHMLYDIYSEYRIAKRRDSYLKNVAAEYALSYQPLKNMPQKYIDAANASLFSRVFGQVEYDYDTDLDKMRELEKEFVAVMQLFDMPDLSDYSVRFRKLGHHRASGLYYPAMKCMCVDIRTPSSFMHEFFHLCDFAAGELSLKARFLAVRQTYERILRDTVARMPENSPEKSSFWVNQSII